MSEQNPNAAAQVALVTGASRGIGAAIALELAQRAGVAAVAVELLLERHPVRDDVSEAVTTRDEQVWRGGAHAERRGRSGWGAAGVCASRVAVRCPERGDLEVTAVDCVGRGRCGSRHALCKLPLSCKGEDAFARQVHGGLWVAKSIEATLDGAGVD